MTTQQDVVVIGGGHNGLVCAFYLARKGLKVRILERRAVVGGAAVTEEFHPGFRNSVASYTVSLLQPRVIADMKLRERGLTILERPISNFLPWEGGYLKLGGGLDRTQTEFRRFSAADAEILPRYYDALEGVAEVLRDLALKIPPNAGGGIVELIRAGAQGRKVAGLSLPAQRDILDLFVKSARNFLDGWFENDHVKAAFGFDAVVGNYASPDTPGSAYVLLHHVFGEVNGKKGAWGHAVGGMGAITQLMKAACEETGVVIETEVPVAQVLVDGGKAVGVRTEGGAEHFASVVAANVGPGLLYRKLVDQADLDADFRHRMKGFRAGSGTFRMNVALSELPDFTVLPSQGQDGGEHHRSGIIIAPTLDYMDQAFVDARAYGWSKAPIVEMLIPSTIDDSLAPAG
jgi:phytoene dehydrogenase-like protein